MNEIKTLTIGKLIEALRHIKLELSNEGIDNAEDTKVFLSSDAEGNSFGTLASENVMFSFDFLPQKDSNYGNALIIYPYEEGIDVFNFKGE